jgi:hypothetical protein
LGNSFALTNKNLTCAAFQATRSSSFSGVTGGSKKLGKTVQQTPEIALHVPAASVRAWNTFGFSAPSGSFP